jgi:hypothetical protein
MPAIAYTAEIHLGDDVPCTCGSCAWRGPAEALAPIEKCALDPGDASPAGRCPECDSLAYPDRPQDHLLDAAPALRDALAEMSALFVEIDECGGFAILKRRFLKFPDGKSKRYLAAHAKIEAIDEKARAALAAAV